MNTFVLMTGFNAWVNQKVFETVAKLSDDAYRRDRKAFFGSIHNTLNHLLVVDRLWSRRLAGAPHGIASLDQVLYGDFAALTTARREEDAYLSDLVAGLSKQALAMLVTYRPMAGEGYEEIRADVLLLTLFNHQTHHRGQVHTMLTQDGIEPPPLDVIDYLEDAGVTP